MGTHPIFESDFDCLTELNGRCLTATFSNMNGASFDSTNRASWFHGTMDRSESIQKLTGKRHGTFLVRRSPNHPDDYVLSVSENGRVSQYIVKRQSDNSYTIGDQNFADLPQLLEFYRVHYLDTTTLVSPVERTDVRPERPPLVPSASVDSPGLRASKTLVKTVYDFPGKDEEDLPFRKGEILEIINKQEEQWWTAKNDEGRQGSIPVNYVTAYTNRHSASGNSPNHSRPNSLPTLDPNRKIYAKVIMRRVPNAYDPEALPLEIGDIVTVTRRNVSGQWEGIINDRKGHFPFTHVKIVDASELQ